MRFTLALGPGPPPSAQYPTAYPGWFACAPAKAAVPVSSPSDIRQERQFAFCALRRVVTTLVMAVIMLPTSSAASAPGLRVETLSRDPVVAVAPSEARRATGLAAERRRLQEHRRSAALSATRSVERPATVPARADRRAAALSRTTRAVSTRSMRLRVESRQRILLLAAKDVDSYAGVLRRQKRAAAKELDRRKRHRSSDTAAGGRRASSSRVTVLPTASGVMGARFGAVGSWSRYHTGLDFRGSLGTPIRAARAGVVTFAGNSGDWAGNYVVIRHADGVSTQSSHMSSVKVRAGQRLSAGEVVGAVGNTGRSFGSHLHFELYPKGVRPGDVYRAVDPLPWLTAGRRSR